MIVNNLLQNLKHMTFHNINFDEMLDNRDAVEFDNEWMRVYTQIEDKKLEAGYTAQQKNISETIRKQAYSVIFHLTQNSAFAGYLSDDFAMICDSELTGYHDDWLDKLILSYTNLQFPNGKL